MVMSINSSGHLLSSQATDTQQTLKRIATGHRINSAADDAAGLAIATRFETQLGGMDTAMRNAGDGISLFQTGEGAMESLTSNIQRMRELALSSANGTLNNDDRKALQAEVTQLQEANQHIIDTSNFNGIKLFGADSKLSFQVGPNTGDQINVSSDLSQILKDSQGISIGSAAQASEALSKLDASLESISQARSEFGAVQNRFESTITQQAQARENTAAANSRIRDSDIAREASTLAQQKIRDQAGIAVQAQANAQAQQVLKLLG
ncbi:MAG: flagellin-like protein [Hahellaceae bacterium]|nr:flagellin-like protein [Hahellaceae bacterium]